MTSESGRPEILAPTPAAIARAGVLVRSGQLVAFPTETVYGLGANATDPAAVERIFRAKGRPAQNPLIVHVANPAAAHGLVSAWPEAAERLAQRFWPGPLTLVLPRAHTVPDQVTAGRATVALRVPAHPVAQALLRSAGVPLAAPSANLSGAISPTTAAHVAASLGERVGLILDGGPTDIGIESTVVDLSGPVPAVLRPGAISRAELESVLGPLGEPAPEAPGAAQRSPGTLGRHYAPRARVVLFDRKDGPEKLPAVQQCRAAAGRVAGLVREGYAGDLDPRVTLPDDPAGYAREMYRALHQLDAAAADLIAIERPPAGAPWDAVRDRLERAAREA